MIEEWTASRRQALWRLHSDRVNTALMQRWLSGGRLQRILKTDLFDEAVTAGLYPVLSAATDRLVGIDNSAGIADAAARRYADMEVHTADVRKLPFENDSFDTVVSISTLDHFEDFEDISHGLAEIARVLRPGGDLLLTLDNLGQPIVWLRSILSQDLMLGSGLVPYRVGKTCRPGRLRELVRQVGLQVVESTAVLHCPRVLAVACANLLDRGASDKTKGRFLSILSAFEWLERLPTRYLTGHFAAIHARKP
jgi:SAM-dependent methyltransferase